MKKALLALVMLLGAGGAFAQIEGHVTWAYGAKKVNATQAVVLLKASIDNGWHIYSANKKATGSINTKFVFAQSKDYTPMGKLAEPEAISKFDKNLNMNLAYFENSVVFQQKVKLTGKKALVKGSLEYIACNDRRCLPPETVEFNVQVAL